MLYERNNPVGLDQLIHKAQKKIYAALTKKWDKDLDGYPRCYVLEDESEKRTVEHYTYKNEYSGNLIVSERDKFFFTAEDDQERLNNIQFETKVKLYFILDLKFIYPDEPGRCDAKVLADVVNAVDKSGGFTNEYTIVTDYQSVFESFLYEFDNIQPYYCFRIDLKTIPYSIDSMC
ncbi:hypothetical protein [Chryseobacterium sp. WLY505]|uniref:hypothetical protein n=1 Tax=Chryseobacterium sp. WLY505 TaxID=3068892 RepID=UPI002796A4D7|nr:hypothetical protein [Chryseobacterium sp. WLY505]MDQ1855756.1 hypothetical protein [Chryseobacterium sp. WLY505]